MTHNAEARSVGSGEKLAKRLVLAGSRYRRSHQHLPSLLDFSSSEPIANDVCITRKFNVFQIS